MPEAGDGPVKLSAVPPGGQAVVDSLEGGRDFRARAANLGFTSGAQVEMVQNYGHGPVLVSVRGALVALGRGEAEQVRVGGLIIRPRGSAARPWRRWRPRWARRQSGNPEDGQLA